MLWDYLNPRGISPCSRPSVLPIFLLIVWPFVVLAQTENHTYNNLADIPGGQFTGPWATLHPGQGNTTLYSSKTFQDAFVMYFRGSAIYIFGSCDISSGLPFMYVNGSSIDYVNTTSVPSTLYQPVVWSIELGVEGDHQLIIRNTPTGATTPTRMTVGSITITSNGDPRPRTSGFAAASIPSEAPVVDDIDPRIVYSGNWSFWWWSGGVGQEIYKGTSHSSSDLDANATFTFHGTAIWYYAYVGPYSRIASVSVDDEAPGVASMVNQFWLGQQLVWSRTDLTDGEHTLKIRQRGGDDGITVDFLRYLPSQSTLNGGTPVSGHNQRPPLRLIIPPSTVVPGVLVLGVLAVVLYRKRGKNQSDNRSQRFELSEMAGPAGPPLQWLVAGAPAGASAGVPAVVQAK